MRFAAHLFVDLLQKRPTLETSAFFIVGWVGVKLGVIALAHPKVGILPHHFPESFAWKLIFWVVLLGIVLVGFLTSREKKPSSEQEGSV